MELAGHETPDILLSFFGAAAHVRREDHIGQALELGDERLVLAFGLAREHIDGRAGDVAALDMSAERRMVDDKTPATGS